MLRTHSYVRRGATPLFFAAALLIAPGMASAQIASGDASAARLTTVGILGRTTTASLADTGPLSDSDDGRAAALQTASIPSLFAGEVLHATTVAWPDQVASKASLANVALQVGGVGITADFIMASAMAMLGSTSQGASWIENLSINGVPIAVTGEPNQAVSIPGGWVVINEQASSAAGATTVNALHATVHGVADVVVASATAGIQ